MKLRKCSSGLEVMGRRFCVRCGKEEGPDTPIIDGLCPKCFMKERGILKLPTKIRVTTCPMCGALYIHGNWIHVGENVEDAIEYFINETLVKRHNIYPGLEDVKAKVVRMDSGVIHLRIMARYKGVRMTQDAVTHVELHKKPCPLCLRNRSGSYEAMLQIRTVAPARFDVMRGIGNRLAKVKEFRESIVEIKEHKDGVDVKLNNQAIGRYVANILKREYAAKITMTWENTGYLGGKRRSKLTISARLPGVVSGDIIEYGGEPAEVMRLKKGRIIVKRLSDGKIMTLRHEDLWRSGFRYLDEKDYAVLDGRILNYEGGKAVVQATDSGNIYFIKSPRILNLGSHVKILIYKGKAYLLI